MELQETPMSYLSYNRSIVHKGELDNESRNNIAIGMKTDDGLVYQKEGLRFDEGSDMMSHLIFKAGGQHLPTQTKEAVREINGPPVSEKALLPKKPGQAGGCAACSCGKKGKGVVPAGQGVIPAGEGVVPAGEGLISDNLPASISNKAKTTANTIIETGVDKGSEAIRDYIKRKALNGVNELLF